MDTKIFTLLQHHLFLTPIYIGLDLLLRKIETRLRLCIWCCRNY